MNLNKRLFSVAAATAVATGALVSIGSGAAQAAPSLGTLTITPATGLTTGGTAVTISGSEFRQDAGVYFGATAATAIVVAADGLSITANTPASTLAGPVNVRPGRNERSR